MPAPQQPDGVTPHLFSPQGAQHVEWLKAVFGAEVLLMMHKDPSEQKIMHSLLAINGGFIYLCDAESSLADGAPDQATTGGDDGERNTRGFRCHLELSDPRATWERAMGNGCTSVVDLRVQSWGALYGSFRDPFGFEWSLMKAGDDPARGVIASLLTPSGECEKHVDWLKSALGAEVKSTYHTDDGKIMHCAVALNGGLVYLADAPAPEAGENGAAAAKPSGIVLHMYMSEARPAWETAHKHGAATNMELKVQFWGETYGTFKDIFGYEWSMAQKAAAPAEPRRSGIIPYLISPDCKKHVEWITSVFAGEQKELIHANASQDKVMHCAVEVNDGVIYLADGYCSPIHKEEGDPHGFLCHQKVPDPQAVWDRAVANGATVTMELKTQFWGDVYGSFKDVFGYEWSLSPKTSAPCRTGVIAHLISRDCTKHIDWIKNVFGGKVNEIHHSDSSKTKVMHCEVEFNDGVVYLADTEGEAEERDAHGFLAHVSVADPDSIWKKAMANGGTVVMELKNQHWGDYYGMFCDPFGFSWAVARPAITPAATD